MASVQSLYECRAEVITTHAPSTLDAWETLAWQVDQLKHTSAEGRQVSPSFPDLILFHCCKTSHRGGLKHMLSRLLVVDDRQWLRSMRGPLEVLINVGTIEASYDPGEATPRATGRSGHCPTWWLCTNGELFYLSRPREKEGPGVLVTRSS
jgi:hypothetical protein